MACRLLRLRNGGGHLTSLIDFSPVLLGGALDPLLRVRTFLFRDSLTGGRIDRKKKAKLSQIPSEPINIFLETSGGAVLSGSRRGRPNSCVHGHNLTSTNAGYPHCSGLYGRSAGQDS